MAGDQTTNPSQNDPDKPTDWQQIGKAVAAGMDAIGFVEKFGKAVVTGSVDATRKARAYGIKALAVVFSALVGALFDLIGQLDPAFGSLAATIVGNMFDIEVDASAFTNMKAQGGRKQIAVDVGAALLRAFKGDQVNAGPGELEPSVTSAESYLGMMANLAIEGWVFEVIGGLVPDLQLEELGELKDAMARVLGLGRLSRTVLHPFVNTLIAQPATWAVNKQYRPKMLTVSEAIRANFRGDVDDATLQEISARDGYGDDALAALVNAERKRMAPADLDLRVRAGQLSQPDAIAALRGQGYEDGPANEALNLEELKARRAHILRVAGVAIAAYAEHKSDQAALSAAIDALGFDDTTLGWLHDEADARRLANTPHLAHAEVIAAVKASILNVTDYAAWLTARGYTDVDAVTLELTLQNELNELADKAKARATAAATRAANAAAKLQAQQAKRDELAATHADWTGTLGQAERLVVRSVMPPTQYRQVLIDHLLSPGDADALVSVAVADRDAYTAALAKKAAAVVKTSTPVLSIATLERATTMGALSLEQLQMELAARKYEPADIAVIVDLTKDALAARAAALARTAAAAAKFTGKSISLSAVQKAVVDGVQTLAQYGAFLTAQKFSTTDVATLVADMQVQLDNRALANARHDAAAEKLAGSHLSLAEEEKAVVDGILTLADYTLWLESHGFDAADQAILTQLLQTKLK